jgi:hypothetical protein
MNWIEQLLQIDPDGGNGTLELLIVTLLVAVIVSLLIVRAHSRGLVGAAAATAAAERDATGRRRRTTGDATGSPASVVGPPARWQPSDAAGGRPLPAASRCTGRLGGGLSRRRRGWHAQLIHIGRSKTQAGLREIRLLPILRDELAAHEARSYAAPAPTTPLPPARSPYFCPGLTGSSPTGTKSPVIQYIYRPGLRPSVDETSCKRCLGDRESAPVGLDD